MAISKFKPGVKSKIASYVYRLIDPRNGETFYVGKGEGDRVFNHVSGKLSDKEAETSTLTPKMNRIHEIRNDHMEVIHVIHRHGMGESTAFEVEGALIDAYPGLTNKAGGHGNALRGAAHADQLNASYAAEALDIEKLRQRVIEITVIRTAAQLDIYDATRFAWRASLVKARKADLVFAVISGQVREVFKPIRWDYATKENFKEMTVDTERPSRIAFEGELADNETRAQFLKKRMPDRARGAANPIRYFYSNAP